MRLLVDSHAVIWFAQVDPQLTAKAREIIAVPDNQLFLSAASIWEIAIKVSTGKLVLALPFDGFLHTVFDVYGFELLPVGRSHAERVSRMPFHHTDPFDRMIAAQSLEEGLPLVSKDRAFDSYGVARIW